MLDAAETTMPPLGMVHSLNCKKFLTLCGLPLVFNIGSASFAGFSIGDFLYGIVYWQ
ncbi:hypothetical protein Tco_1025023, partial [Tanacetum coccineum]